MTVLTAAAMKRPFRALNDELKSRGVMGEVLLCGGAVMCIVFQARKATKDVDAIFAPTREIREAARKVAGEIDAPPEALFLAEAESNGEIVSPKSYGKDRNRGEWIR